MKLCAAALVFKDHKIVCIDDAKGRGIILPGGKCDGNEDPEHAAKRELYEETGLIGFDPLLLLHMPFHNGSYTFCYLMSLKEYEPVDSDEGNVILAGWSDLFQSKYGWWYKILQQELRKVV